MKGKGGISKDAPVVVIGAGPAGLTAAYELARQGIPVIVFEQDSQTGGLSKTVEYKGYRFDIGGHRFFTKIQIVHSLWHMLLGEDLLLRSRLSRILYRGRYFDYPLKLFNAFFNMGIFTSMAILLSYFRSLLFPVTPEVSFADWVTNRFGKKLYTIFFKTYTEKVWGIPCEQISSHWAAQRIKGLSLRSAFLNMLSPGSKKKTKSVIKTLINEFDYPRQGPGMMWKALSNHIEDFGGTVHLSHRVVKIVHGGGRITGVEVQHDGKKLTQPVSQVISSMSLLHLVHAMLPVADQQVIASAARLKYRDFLTVALIIDEPDIFPDNWLYIHDESVMVGRIQNFKNWSPEMVPDQSKTCLGMEYFCFEGDGLWKMCDDELISFAKKELASIGLVPMSKVSDGNVVRVPKAYPIYDEGYRDAVGSVREYLKQFSNLQEIGRNGMHKYNNMDHSMLTAIFAVRNVLGEHHDLWSLNADDTYHEETGEDEIESGADFVL